MVIRLRVLGSLDVHDDEARDLGHVMAQPKRLALLAYLAAAMPAGLHRRDRVLALLGDLSWYERLSDIMLGLGEPGFERTLLSKLHR